ncbi:MucBP domain-containing protein [Lentilactobacillus senioris]|uniref:MucBP domain-containing protein n=1 Tax=Lentilactobacillus senioris TaxID=931534 RepID=UPI00227FBDD4|nr:MucBP domain-containing protein [Lentilactobacillus senioris]MCY9806706.1 MucBP domain-containing protein [Lentilactobacillus senioris]
MSLLSWLNNRFKRKTPTTKSTSTTSTQNNSASKKSEIFTQAKTKVEATPSLPKLTPQPTQNQLTLKNSTITYFLVDEHNELIQAPERIVGTVGQRVHYQIPTINDYLFTGVDELITTFPEQDATVTISYLKTPGAPVQIYHLNYDTGQIMHPMQVLNGNLGQSYQTIPINFPDYRVIQSTGLTKGVFTNKTNQIVYFYRPQNWHTVQPVHQFIKLTTPTPVFSDINGEQLPVALPAQITLRVFTIITTNDDQSWLDLGGAEWIKASSRYQKVNPLVTPEITSSNWQREQLATTATVDIAPNTTVASYNRPNGQAVNNWTNNTAIEVTSKVVDEQQVVWYQLKDQSYLPAIFVNVSE